MTRTITHSEFVNGAGEGVYVSHVHYMSRAERKAGDAANQAVVAPAAFTPALSAGEAFDSAEVVPPAASGWCNAPPNCGLPPSEIAHSGQEPTQAGQVLAHAQHEAAISGAECNGTACLMTRGAND